MAATLGDTSLAHDKEPYGAPGNERIGAFSDGVFAIAITLLVLELKVPEHVPVGGLLSLLPELLPKIAGHVVSFAVLGIYWVGHHNMFMHIKRHDRNLLWLNILFLMFVAAMPFMTGLIAEYGDDRLSITAYAADLVLAGLSLELIWIYVTHDHRLVDQRMSPDVIAWVHRRVMVAPLVYLLAIGVSLVSISAAKILFFLVVVGYIVPEPGDHLHLRQIHQSTDARHTSVESRSEHL